MKLSYYDPLIGIEQTPDNLEQLVAQLQALPRGTEVEFLARPFHDDLESVRNISTLLSHHLLQENLSFVVAYNFDQVLLPEVVLLLKKWGVYCIEVDAPVEALESEQLDNWLSLLHPHGIHLCLELKATESTTLSHWEKAYHFLQNYWQKLYIKYEPNSIHFPEVARWFERFARELKVAFEVGLMRRKFNFMLYQNFYNFLQQEFSPTVRNILEINPYGNELLFKNHQKNNVEWKIEQAPLQGGTLNWSAQSGHRKTYDAIVFFQGLEMLRSPEKEMLLLQHHARSSTEWAVLSYNSGSIPVLMQLLKSQFENIFHNAPGSPFLRFNALQGIESLFKNNAIDMTAYPQRIPLKELEEDYRRIENLIQGQLGEELKTIPSEGNVLTYILKGRSHIDALTGGDGFASENGFMDAGFSGGGGFLS